MIFRQLLDQKSRTYTYIVAARRGGEALIVDPVMDAVDDYLRVLRELDVHLAVALDTHTHADHVTGIGLLHAATLCATAMGEQSAADCVSTRLREGEPLMIDDLRIDPLYTPGHTDDSYSLRLDRHVLTGDTLLIRGTGRTDFQNGDPGAQYDSLFDKLLKLPDETIVCPGHDYDGRTCSSIREERRHNPRLQVESREAYIEMMNRLSFEPPRLMDFAIPANRRCGLNIDAGVRF